MADLRTLTLALVADVEKFKKGLDKADSETKGFSTKLKSALKAGALAFAALGTAAAGFAIKFGKDAITAASDFNEELSKSEVVLGDAAKSVQNFAETAAKTLGQSRTEALRAASNFAIFGKSAGLSGKELADFSTDFTTLASDLASFNNTTPEDAVLALGAALRGESEPIRRYGVLLNDATLKQRALELGIIENTKNALTPQQKVLAASAEIFAQTADAQGDFERTSDGLANTQRQLRASLEDVKIELGEALLPKALEFANFAKDTLLPAFEGLIRGLTGGPRSTKGATKEAGSAFAELGIVFEENDQAGYNLGQSLRELGETFFKLFGVVDDGTSEEGGFAKFINQVSDLVDNLVKLVEWLDKAIGKYQEFKRNAGSSFVERGIVNEGTTVGGIGAIEQKRRQKTEVNINVRGGALNPQGVAREIVNVVSKATNLSGLTFEQRAALR